ncbi:subtilase family serine protease [Rhodanobacter sp. K2T2]|uniref:S53 family peptidase n=1 Tax=Rhodanobacter sp. K2T2 TaxID=2723085 RepID=UPI0015CD326D|nr:protease pro-enzyme activation domain-containing protein [Rhodanobacter sp. K2T2]NYE27120.1 subtilase family serine protease [Rhodanobacter sp. K2T2]
MNIAFKIVIAFIATCFCSTGYSNPLNRMKTSAASSSSDSKPVATNVVPSMALVGSLPADVASGHAVRAADLPATIPIRLTIVVMPHRSELASFIDQVSDPASPTFHRFLTFDQLKSRFMASDADVESVEAWARAGGLSEVQRWPSNHAIVIQGTVGQVNTLLGVKLGKYSLNGNVYYANDKRPTISSEIAPKIADILGLNSMQQVLPLSQDQGHSSPIDTPRVSTEPFISRTVLRGDAQGSVHGHVVTPKISATMNSAKPADIRTQSNPYVPSDIWSESAYNYDGLAKFSHCCNPAHLATGSPPETSIAIIGENKADPNDVNKFFIQYGLAEVIENVAIDGPACCDDEMTIDTEWAGAMSNSKGANSDTATIHVYEGGGTQLSDQLNAWEAAFTDDKARVASTSFGAAESGYGGLGTPSIGDFTDITNAMTALGWTIVAAAGDTGVDYYGGNGCNTTNVVQYPATDPNVVAAGGSTLILNTDGTFSSENAWSGNACAKVNPTYNGGGGGGGCSNNTFPATAWNNTGCPSNRRAIPDMSLNASPNLAGQGAGQSIYYSYGKCKGNGAGCFATGSSIVAPELAGFFAQENSYLLTLGNICGTYHDAPCAPLGRAGPIIFATVHQPHNPFYDIEQGSNANGQSNGYQAARGYDLATGLGSVNMMQLAWAINYYLLSNGSTPPIVSFSGAQLDTLYTGPVTVDFQFNGANRGIAGYTAYSDRDPGDPKSELSPGTGSPFWDGPQVVGSPSGGSIQIPFAPGCHMVYVRVWDNLGDGNTQISYGPICMGGANTKCSFAEKGCPAQGGYEGYQITCPMTVNFSVNGQLQQSGTSFSGQEQPNASSYVTACTPGTANCQGFSIPNGSGKCPIHVIPPPPPPLKTCQVCDQTHRQCVAVTGGYVCKGLIQ